MMKAATMVLLSALVVSCSMLHRNANDIINDMRDARHAQYVNVGSGLLGLGKLISPTLSQAGLGVSSIQVLDLSNCNPGDRDKFRKRIQNLISNRSYEEIVTKQAGYDTSTALVRRDGQFVSEVVIVKASEMKDVMLLIQGHINVANLERIINEASKTSTEF